MNVLEVYTNFLPKHGGVETHIYDMCKYLLNSGHKPVVFTLTPPTTPFEVIDGIRIHRIRIPRFMRFTRYPMICYLTLNMIYIAKKYKVDIIHAHDYLPGLAAVFAGIFLHKPVVTTFHLPIQRTTFPALLHSFPAAMVEILLRKLFISWANVICVSKFTYNETLKLGFPSSKIKIIYNWVTSSVKNVKSNNAFRETSLKGKKYILSVGRLSEKQKQFSVLLRAFKLLLDKGHKMDLVIVGDGPDKNAYRKCSASLNIENYLHLLDGVTNETLKSLYECCEFFVLPSKFEGLPLVLLEAMSHGKPIISTNVGGVPEVVEDGQNGILVTPLANSMALAIEKLIQNPDMVSAFGKRSKEIVQRNFSKRNCKTTMLFLEKIAKEN